MDKRKCYYKNRFGEILPGKFLGFGVCYEELDGGVGTLTVALIELENGLVEIRYLPDITFGCPNSLENKVIE